MRKSKNLISILIWLLVVVFHSTTISNILKTQNSKLQALNLMEIRISLGASSGSLCYLWSRCIFFVYYNAPSIFICLTNFYDWQMNAKIHSYIHFLLRIELLYFFNNWFHTKAIYIYISIYIGLGNLHALCWLGVLGGAKPLRYALFFRRA